VILEAQAYKKSEHFLKRSVRRKAKSDFKKMAQGYTFGFNGQEKTNEIAGVGNHNTAEHWEYDPRTGRRWNTDPITKPFQSGYSTFSNSPIIMIDPNGDDDYYNKQGKFIGSDGVGHAIRLMDNKAIQSKATFSAAMSHAKNTNIEFSDIRNKLSREIKFKDEGIKLGKMMKSAESERKEKGVEILLDVDKAEVSTSEVHTGESNEEVGLYGAGTKLGNKIVLGGLHTHQAEKDDYSLGATDQNIFDTQDKDGDGLNAKTIGDNKYTFGTKNIDYHGPKTSQNNISTRKALEAGTFELGKDALKKYGKQDAK
jgi:hypothetical protein